jgi:hypothetical protein
MRSFHNPFRTRASEQVDDPHVFLRQFGAGMLELLPEAIWDRPLLLLSAPGGGKTSLMRLFTAESLRAVRDRRQDYPDLVKRLSEMGVLANGRPDHLGVLLNLGRDYRSLVDLGLQDEVALRLFFRLLDSRIMVGVMRSALVSSARAFPADAAAFSLSFEDVGAESEAATLFGGTEGSEMLDRARQVERETLQPLDSLLPIEEAAPRGGTDLYSLRVLSVARLHVDGKAVSQTPLLMLDDGHELDPLQREALLKRLGDRSLRVGRWYSERYEALDPTELMHGAIRGRDFEVVELESLAREGRRRAGHRFNFARVMREVADSRAGPALQRYAGEQQDFSDLVSVDFDQLVAHREEELAADLQQRLAEVTRDQTIYERALTAETDARGYERLVGLRELEIAIRSHQARPQRELFPVAPSQEELDERRKRVRQAARLFLAREAQLPYYCGIEVLERLGSQNMEQFLRVCGDIFDLMLARITMRDRPTVAADQQDRVVRRASESLWNEIPRRLPHGPDVQRLLLAMAELAQRQTYRPTAPYPPGVTGIAITMRDYYALIDPIEREKLDGAGRLFDALASAFAHNVLSPQPNYQVQGRNVIVIYFNRLLCPRFNLPLGYGGFRIRDVAEVAGWFTGSSAARPADEDEFDLEMGEAAQLTL